LTATDQANATDVDRLLADVDGAAPDVHVGVADRRQHLRQGDAVGIQLVEVDLDVVGLRRAPPGVHLNHPGNGQQASYHDPIVQRAKIAQPEVRRPGELIAVDLADQAGPLNRRLHAVGHIDPLLQAVYRLRVGEVVIDAVAEHHAHEGQSVDGVGADELDPGSGRETDLHGNRVVAFHLLSREALGLGGDFEDD